MRCDGTWTNGAAALMAVCTTALSGLSSSLISRQKLSAASRYWAWPISSCNRSGETLPLAITAECNAFVLHREPDREACPLSDTLAVRFDFAAVLLDDRSTNRQTEARSAVGPRVRGID